MNKKVVLNMDKILNWISENYSVLTGAVFAFVIAFIQKKGDIMDKLTGAFLCSLFSTGLFYGLVSIFPNCPQSAAVALGSFVGFYGVDECKELILNKVRSFLKSEKEEK